jgi:hypothetical protein
MELRDPQPTLRFRQRAWRLFQRQLDPLAPPRPLRLSRTARLLARFRSVAGR